MGVQVREISIAEQWEAAGALMRENWAETGFDFEFAPNREAYVQMQERGLIIALGAFDDEELVGYCTAYVGGHPFNPAVLACLSDVLFLTPHYRRGLTAGRMVAAMERIAKARGATRILWHTRAGTALAESMVRHGYRPADQVVMKGL